MRSRLIIPLLTVGIIVGSCRRDQPTANCLPGAPTIRQIVDKQATIKITAMITSVYLVEQGAIDTKLTPCNLPKEFLQNDLQVTISGDVKSTPPGAGPCCSENFVITKITR